MISEHRSSLITRARSKGHVFSDFKLEEPAALACDDESENSGKFQRFLLVQNRTTLLTYYSPNQWYLEHVEEHTRCIGFTAQTSRTEELESFC